MRYNRKTVKVTSSTDSPAITLADMKAFLRVDGTADDDQITAYIATATETVKQNLQRAVLTETFVLKADGFSDPNGDDRLMALGPGIHTGSRHYLMGGGETLDLPYPPVQSVTSIVTYDRGNNASTFSSDLYQVGEDRIFLNDGQTWPSDLRAQDAVQITYVAGYGSGSIPGPILQAIRMHVSSLYDGTCEGLTHEAMRMLAPFRRMDGLAW